MAGSPKASTRRTSDRERHCSTNFGAPDRQASGCAPWGLKRYGAAFSEIDWEALPKLTPHDLDALGVSRPNHLSTDAGFRLTRYPGTGVSGFSIRKNFSSPRPGISGASTPTSSFQKLRSCITATQLGTCPSCEKITPPGTNSGYKYFRQVRTESETSTSTNATATGSLKGGIVSENHPFLNSLALISPYLFTLSRTSSSEPAYSPT